ncbi:MAG: hypothetical protein CBB71_05610 [Rhodopirellula sp. TMED11]|nr:MAG: hypothetical protein CBB71_05610 [Rhodopirellula sp. TMED11]
MLPFGKPSKTQFATRLIRAIAEQTGIEFGYDSDENELRRLDGDGVINIANLYLEHCKLKKRERAEHLQVIAGVFGQRPEALPSEFSEAKRNLRPKIWTRAVFEFQNLKSQLTDGKSFDMPNVPLGSHLAVTLVYDTDHAMRSVSEEELANWDVSFDAGMQQAIANLDQDTTTFAKLGDALASSMTGDAYDSSRILLNDRLRKLGLEGDLIALVPTRDSFLVATANDRQAVEMLYKVANLTDEDEPVERPLSPLPLVFRDGQRHDWQPPQNHAIRPLFEQVERDFLGSLYNEQKELLEALWENDPEAPFLPTYTGAQRASDNEVFTYSVWSRGAKSLLPNTDVVMLFDSDQGVTIPTSWQQMLTVLGDAVVLDDSIYPSRYLVDQFPSEPQLIELADIDLDLD